MIQFKHLKRFIDISKKTKELLNFGKLKCSKFENSKLHGSYIPIPKNRFVNEILRDSSIVHPSQIEQIKRLALFIDKKSAVHYGLKSKELSLLFRPDISSLEAASTGEPKLQLSRRQLIDQEFLFLRELTHLLAIGGFIEVTKPLPWAASAPHNLGAQGVKTYIDPVDYDVLRVWTQGPQLSPSVDSSLDPLLTPIHRCGSMLRKVAVSLMPKFLAGMFAPSDRLPYEHVLLVYRLKANDRLQLKLLTGLAMSRDDTLTDTMHLLPEQRFVGFSRLQRSLVVLSCGLSSLSLTLLTPLAFLLLSAAQPQLVLAWSSALTAVSALTASLLSLKEYRARALWSQHLHTLSFGGDLISGAFALAHIIGLAETELFKSALLVHCLLLRPTADGLSLTLVELEQRGASWVASRLLESPNLRPFEASLAVDFLRDLNLIQATDNRLQALDSDTLLSAQTLS